MDRRDFVRTVVPTTAFGLAGCLSGSAETDYDVSMGAVEFRPETLEAKVGTTIKWRNTSKQGHSVTAYESGIPEKAAYFASGGFESEQAARDAWGSSTEGTLFEGQSYEHTFKVPGEYPYFCIPHESAGMVGSIVITDVTGTPATDADSGTKLDEEESQFDMASTSQSDTVALVPSLSNSGQGCQVDQETPRGHCWRCAVSSTATPPACVACSSHARKVSAEAWNAVVPRFASE